MHLKVIACEVVGREVYHCAARSVNTAEIALFSQGLHDNSDTCRHELQAQIDAVDPQRYDALLLGYGLCNNSIVGLRAGRLRLVVPRAHDCITFFLGSKERYAQLFAERPGTYWYTSGWLEYEGRGGERIDYKPNSGLAKRMKFQELVEKYGEENAKYLAESMSQWEVHYTHGCLIEFPFTRHLGLETRVRKVCGQHKWQYASVPGELGLIQDWLDGQWDADRFLVLEPGEKVKGCYDDRVIDVDRA
jgi:hypothetical protein